MGFPYDAMYLIEAMPSFIGRMHSLQDDDLADILLRTQLFRQREYSDSAWREPEYLESAKLLFLASLQEYPPLDTAEGFEMVFGTACISARVFDRWFQMRRFMVDDDLESFGPDLSKCTLPIESLGQYYVDRWLSGLRESNDPKS